MGKGKNITEKEKICFYCGTTDSPKFGRIEGKVYCNKHLLQLMRYGEIKKHTLKDWNTYRIDEINNCVYIDTRDINGKINATFIVDLDDFEKVKKYKWSLTMKESPYIFNRQRSRKPIHIYLARYLLNVEYQDGTIVDHINGDTLDNRKSNLRIVDHSQNCMNTKVSIKSSTGYKGVVFNEYYGKYQASITAYNRYYYLGLYNTLEEAVEARKSAEIKLFKEYSRQYRKEVIDNAQNRK